MPQLIPAAAAVAKASLAWAAQAAPAIAFEATKAVAALAITAGLNAIAQAQIPDPESGKSSRRQPRPERAVFMGAHSRGGPAYVGSDRT